MKKILCFQKSKMLSAKKITIIYIFILGSKCLAEISINNYGDSSYPGRCVLEMGDSIVLLTSGQSTKLNSLPCTHVFCMSDGWGMLYTCEREEPPDDCRFTDILDWDAPYPDCCKRRVVCD